MPEINTIYVKPVGGLCNRMRTVDSCIALGKKTGKKVTVIWGRDQYLNCRFSDLFQPSAAFKVIEESQYFGKKAPFPYLPGSKPASLLKSALFQITSAVLHLDKVIWFEELDHALQSLRKKIEPAHLQHMKAYELRAIEILSPFVKQIEEAGNVFLCSAWRLWPNQHYKNHFVPIHALRHRIESTTAQFNHTTGIHIRRGDHDLAKYHSSLTKFKDAMNAMLHENAKATFFLATDCAQTEKALVHSYPGKIITYQKQSYSRNTTMGIQDALIDLYCLSETKKVLGSYFSSYSQVAAEISGIDEITIH